MSDTEIAFMCAAAARLGFPEPDALFGGLAAPYVPHGGGRARYDRTGGRHWCTNAAGVSEAELAVMRSAAARIGGAGTTDLFSVLAESFTPVPAGSRAEWKRNTSGRWHACIG